MILRDRPMTAWGPPLVCLILALGLLGSDAGGVASSLRGALFDALLQSHPRPYQEVSGHPVRIVEIDPQATAQFGAWPWSHTAQAKLVQAIAQAGTAVLVYNGRIDRPDPLSSRTLVELVPAGPEFEAARQALSTLPAPDSALAAAFAGTKSVTGVVLGKAGALPRLKAQPQWSGGRYPFAQVPRLPEAASSLPVFETASAGLGATNVIADKDGLVRRMPLVFRLAPPGQPEKIVPSLDAEVLRLIENRPSVTLKSDDGNSGFFGGRPAILAVETRNGPLPTASDGSIWLAYAGPDPRRVVAASDLLMGKLPAQALRGAIVYLANPGETVMTPMGSRPLAEVHAEAAENLLTGTVLRRPLAAGQAELLCLFLFGAGGIFLFVRFGTLWSAAYTAATTAAIAFGAWRLFVTDHVLLDAAGLGLALWTVWATGALMRLFEIWQARRALRLAFTDVLPPQVIQAMARQPESMTLAGEKRTVTYLACAIRGFAGLAESYGGDPAAFTRLVQRILDPLMAQALNHGGAIDKLTAEGFTAFWNAPLDDPEHGLHACEAAMGMMEAVAQLNEILIQERRKEGDALEAVEIGIGIASGPAIAGGFKVHGRTVYSATGECAVEAGRILPLSAQYGPAVVVSDTVREIAERGFAFLEVDYTALEPGAVPVKLFAMLGNPVMRASPKFRALTTFHEHIFQALREQQWNKARALISQCRKLSGASQKLYDLHLTRIAYLESHPPGADWDGAYRPTVT